MDVLVIPIRTDNYVYVLRKGGRALVVDPGEAAPVLRCLAERDLDLEAILVTHHHADHTAGVRELKRATGCRVHGPDDPRVDAVDRAVGEGDRVVWGGGEVAVLATPGHTRTSLCFAAHDPPHARAGALFTGDTLFVSGCGRPFECPSSILWQSLLRLVALPETMRVYCGHEYSGENLAFAASILPDDPAIAARTRALRECASVGDPTVGLPLGDERRANLFLRAGEPVIARALGMPAGDPEAVFTRLRRLKDAF